MVASRSSAPALAALVAAASLPTASAFTSQVAHRANPVRKVVNLLQAMQKKVLQEGEAADDLYEKFMCYCKTNTGDLSAGVEKAAAKIEELEAVIEASISKKAQLESTLKAKRTDRAAAEKTIANAKAIRAKEKAAFDKEYAEGHADYTACSKAVTAISNGMEGGFLQTAAAGALKAAVKSSQSLEDTDRDSVLAFLEGQGPSSSAEILGTLKQMQEEMKKAQEDLMATEEASVKEFDALVKAKEREIKALTKSIEAMVARVGELGIKVVTSKGDLEDTKDGMAEDKVFAVQLKKDCSSKKEIHEEEKKMRGQEIAALADTIKTLNSDDALELFKKTLPSASSASFLQIQETGPEWRQQARATLLNTKVARHRLSYILMALRGKKVGFDKILKLVDHLTDTLRNEQEDDDGKVKYCTKSLDEADDAKKQSERSIADLGTVIEEANEAIATVTDEIAALKTGIIALDKAVADATEQRRAESAEYKELMSTNTAAKKLLLIAQNRMRKFYAPRLAKDGDGASAAASFLQLNSRASDSESSLGAPPPPPATADAYSKKSEESNGVLAMMNLLIQDLDKEMTIAEVEEKNAQEEYEATIKESAAKRTQDSKTLTDKEASKAELQSTVEESAKSKKATEKELTGTKKIISVLHGECDWLMKYYKVRKAARTDEIDSLTKAKAVLNGADYSF